MEDVVGVSHECDFPSEANMRPRVTKCPMHDAGLASKDVDEWVRRALREDGTIYTIDEPLLRELRPDVILTQRLCDVCAVGYGTVAHLAETLPGPPQVVNLAQRDYELLREFPGFDSVPAAQAGEIYLVNASAYFARPGPRIIDSIEILAGILHPKEFPDFAFRRTQARRVTQHDVSAS